MTASADHEAEILRLARVLGVAPGDLDVLDPVPLESVRELRDTVQDRLLARNHDQFARAVALADRVPGALAAKLAQHAMGSVLGGRAAALLTPAKAAELAHRLPPGSPRCWTSSTARRCCGPGSSWRTPRAWTRLSACCPTAAWTSCSARPLTTTCGSRPRRSSGTSDRSRARGSGGRWSGA